MRDRQPEASSRAPCVLEPLEARLLLDSSVIGGVPQYPWFHGSAPTAAAMVLGYWDRMGYPDYLPGDAATLTDEVKEAIASRGDGDGTQADPGTPGTGHIPDYALFWGIDDYGALIPFPDQSVIDEEAVHPDDCIADFLGTSITAEMNAHGATQFASVVPGLTQYGTYRGYESTYAWYEPYDDLTWGELVGEIDAGRPMILCVDIDGYANPLDLGLPIILSQYTHFVPVVGYRTVPGNQYGCYTMIGGQAGLQWFDWQPLGAQTEWGVVGGYFLHPAWESSDLVGTSTDVEPGTMIWGDSFTYEYEVTNFGTEAAGASDVKFYLSADETIDATDHYLGTASVPALGAGASHGGGEGLSLPASAPGGFDSSGFCYVGMIADADGDVAEGVESNNSSVARGRDYERVAIYGEPDLQGGSFGLSRGILNFGDIRATFHVLNDGTEDSGSFVVKFYLSEDAVIDAADTYLDFAVMGSIPSGDTHGEVIDLAVPEADPFGGDGTYYLGMIVDSNGHVFESDETNNASLGLGLDYARANYGVRIFSADFEHGDGGLEIVNDTPWAPENGLWHRSVLRSGDAGHSSSYCMYYGIEQPSPHLPITNTSGYFQTKTISLPDEPAVLTLSHYADVRGGADSDVLLVEARDVETGTWHTVMAKGGALGAGGGDTGGQWYEAVADLSDLAGKQVRLRFLFDAVAPGLGGGYEGWYIDDVAVWAATNPVTAFAYRNLPYDSDYHHTFQLRGPGHHSTLVFAEDQLDGLFAIVTEDTGSGVNPALAVYDYPTGEMIHVDGDSGPGDQAGALFANDGWYNTYLLEVWDTEEDSGGSIDAAVVGSGTNTSWSIPLDEAGNGSQVRDIGPPADTDFFRVTAPAGTNGTLRVHAEVTGGDLRPLVQIWRDDGDDVPEAVGTGGSVALTDAAPGDVFDISVSDRSFYATGLYELKVDFDLIVPDEFPGDYNYIAAPSRQGDWAATLPVAGEGDWVGWLFASDPFDTSATFAATGTGGVKPIVGLYDADTGERLAWDVNAGDSSAVSLDAPIDAHKRYYFLASTKDGAAGGLNLSMDLDNPRCAPVGIGPDGHGSAAATISPAGDLDYFDFESPASASGTVTIAMTDAPDELTGMMYLFDDATGQFLDSAFASSPGGEAELTFDAVAPSHRYVLAVASLAYQGGAGGVDLSIDFDTSLPATMTAAEGFACFHYDGVSHDTQVSSEAKITYPGDVDSSLFAGDFAWTGSYTLRVNRLTGAVDPVLAVYDATSGEQLGFDDDSGGGTSAELTLDLSEFTRYIVAVADDDHANMGDVEILITAPQGSPALNIPIDNGTGTGQRVGLDDIGDGDTDFFRFTAPADATGQVRVTVSPAGTLAAAAVLLDAAGNEIARAFVGGPGEDEEIGAADLAPGTTYYLSVLARDYATAGDYDVSVAFEQIVPYELPALPVTYPGIPNLDGGAAGGATLDVPDTWAGWYFAGDVDAPDAVFTATGGAGLIPLLGVYDADTGTRLDCDANLTDSGTASVTVDIDRDTKYYLVVAGKDGTTGSAAWTIDLAETSHEATVPIDGDGHGEAAGLLIDPEADIDYFRLTSPEAADGTLEVTLHDVADKLRLQAGLFDHDTGENVSVFPLAGPGGDLVLTVSGLEPDHTYDLAVTSGRLDGGIGGFDLDAAFGTLLPEQIDPADVDLGWPKPNQLGDDSIDAAISPGDPELIVAIQPKAAGPMLFDLTGSGVVPVLGLYDAAGRRLAWALAEAGAAAHVSWPADAEDVYYLYGAAQSRSGTGDLTLDIDVQPFPVLPIPIDPDKGIGGVDDGMIRPMPAQDFYSVVVPLRATSVTVTMDPDDTELCPHLRLYDEAGGLLADDSPDKPGENAAVALASVTPGATYVVGAGGARKTGGEYDLDVAFELYDVPATAPPPDAYGPLNLAGDRDVSLRLVKPDDRAAWRFASRAGGMATFTAAADHGVDPLLALYDGTGTLVALSNAAAGEAETLACSLDDSGVYTLLVQDAQRDDAGDVSLTLDAPSAGARDIAISPSGSGSESDHLKHGKDDPRRAEVDYFAFAAPDGPLAALALTVEPHQAFRLEFQLFDSGGQLLGKQVASDADGEPAAGIHVSPTPGEKYHVAVFACEFDDHPAGGDYTIHVDFHGPLQARSCVPGKGDIVPPGEDLVCTIEFSEPLDQDNLDEEHFGLIGKASGPQTLQKLKYDPETLTLSLVYASLPMDTYELTISERLTDVCGCRLDGDADGEPGGDFARPFSAVLLGDANWDGCVNWLDYLTVKTHCGGSNARWGDGDFNADRRVDRDDFLLVRGNFGHSAPLADQPVVDALAAVEGMPAAEAPAPAASAQRTSAAPHELRAGWFSTPTTKGREADRKRAVPFRAANVHAGPILTWQAPAIRSVTVEGWRVLRTDPPLGDLEIHGELWAPGIGTVSLRNDGGTRAASQLRVLGEATAWRTMSVKYRDVRAKRRWSWWPGREWLGRARTQLLPLT